MKLTFEVTITDSREEFERILRKRGASDADIARLLRAGSVLSIDDFIESHGYVLESELIDMEEGD